MIEYIYGTDEHNGHWLTGEKIVRCKDCWFFKEEHQDNAGFCEYWVDRVIYPNADGFCAWGESK